LPSESCFMVSLYLLPYGLSSSIAPGPDLVPSVALV